MIPREDAAGLPVAGAVSAEVALQGLAVAPTPASELMPGQHKARLLLLAILFMAALGLRLYQITEPMVEFHPMRQNRNAIFARGLYMDGNPSIPVWQRDLAVQNMEIVGQFEPPILDWLAAATYRIVGAEHVWIVRLYSTLFWLMGGGALFWVTRQALSSDAALFATAFFLLLPFGVMGSRTFQADPLMIGLMLISIALIWHFHAQPSPYRLVTAVTASSLAILVKPICGPMIYMGFVALQLNRCSLRESVSDPFLYGFLVATVVPTAIYYGHNLLTNPALQENAQAQFIPGLLMTREYWAGWLSNVRKVVGPVPFIGAILGNLVMTRGPARALLMGLWAGYLTFMLAFTYLVSTHDYYQLQLLPIVGMSLSPLVAPLAQRLGSVYVHPATRMTLLSVLIILAAMFSQLENWWRRYGHEYESVDPALVSIAEDIGRQVEHTPRAILLSQATAAPLRFYGEVSGPAWPATNELQLSRLYGVPALTVQQRLERLISDHAPEYFIITDFAELGRQPELGALLMQRYGILVSTDTYVIFDLNVPAE